MTEPHIPLVGKFVPAHPHGPRVEYVRLSEALSAPRHRDLYLCQYSNEDTPFRLSSDSGVNPSMVIVAFDIDDPGKIEKKARPEWLTTERAKIRKLVEQTNLFAYETKGGFRLVGTLPEPWLLALPSDAAKWTAQYLTWCRWLARVYDIHADTACQDWSRLFRIPHGTRDRDAGPENRWTIGPAHDPGIWAPEIAAEDVVTAEPSRVVPSVNSAERTHPCPLAVRLAHALIAAETLPASVSGQRGHDALLIAASVIYQGFALPRDTAHEVLSSTFNPRCTPPWKESEIAHKLSAAEKNNERWGEEIDAILLSQALEAWNPRPTAREPSDPEEEDAGVSGTREKRDVVASDTPAPTEWLGTSSATALEYFADIGEPVPTGIETVDRITNGGLRRGEPAIFGGAPNTGKTGTVLTIAFELAKKGHKAAVGAFDEPKPRIAVRLGQFLGFDRETLWRGGDVESKRAIAAMPVKIYNGRDKRVTVEWIAEKLGEHGPGIMVLDSLQTARSKLHTPRMTETERLQTTCEAVTDLATQYKHLVLVTSEINREFYKNFDQALELNPMAAFSGTRAIEYTFMFAVVLLQPPNPAEHVLARTAKNKIGDGQPDFALKNDRAHATVYEAPLPSPDRDESDAFDETPPIDLQRVIWGLVRECPCRNKRVVFALLKEKGVKCSSDDVAETLDLLEAKHRITKGEDGTYIQSPWML